MKTESLCQEARCEALKHRYLESEKAGRDLGPEAVTDWRLRHWIIWLRYRWLEHLLGTRCWEEFDPARFGGLPALFGSHMALVGEIADLVRQGAENADIVGWAGREHRDMDLVVRILLEMGIDRIRCSSRCVLLAWLSPT